MSTDGDGVTQLPDPLISHLSKRLQAKIMTTLFPGERILHAERHFRFFGYLLQLAMMVAPLLLALVLVPFDDPIAIPFFAFAGFLVLISVLTFPLFYVWHLYTSQRVVVLYEHGSRRWVALQDVAGATAMTVTSKFTPLLFRRHIPFVGDGAVDVPPSATDAFAFSSPGAMPPQRLADPGPSRSEPALLTAISSSRAPPALIELPLLEADCLPALERKFYFARRRAVAAAANAALGVHAPSGHLGAAPLRSEATPDVDLEEELGGEEDIVGTAGASGAPSGRILRSGHSLPSGVLALAEAAIAAEGASRASGPAAEGTSAARPESGAALGLEGVIETAPTFPRSPGVSLVDDIEWWYSPGILGTVSLQLCALIFLCGAIFANLMLQLAVDAVVGSWWGTYDALFAVLGVFGLIAVVFGGLQYHSGKVVFLVTKTHLVYVFVFTKRAVAVPLGSIVSVWSLYSRTTGVGSAAVTVLSQPESELPALSGHFPAPMAAEWRRGLGPLWSKASGLSDSIAAIVSPAAWRLPVRDAAAVTGALSVAARNVALLGADHASTGHHTDNVRDTPQKIPTGFAVGDVEPVALAVAAGVPVGAAGLGAPDAAAEEAEWTALHTTSGRTGLFRAPNAPAAAESDDDLLFRDDDSDAL